MLAALALCVNLSTLQDRLQNTYGERLATGGLAKDHMSLTYANTQTGTWTRLSVDKYGCAIVEDAGTNWITADQAPA